MTWNWWPQRTFRCHTLAKQSNASVPNGRAGHATRHRLLYRHTAGLLLSIGYRNIGREQFLVGEAGEAGSCDRAGPSEDYREEQSGFFCTLSMFCV